MLQAAEIAIVEQPPDHFVRDMPGTRFIEFQAGVVFQFTIEPGQRGLHSGCNKGLGFNDHNGTAISIAEVQIEKWHPDNLVPRDAARNAALGLLSIGTSTPDVGTRGHHPVTPGDRLGVRAQEPRCGAPRAGG